MALEYQISPEEAEQWNWRVAFPFLAGRVPTEISGAARQALQSQLGNATRPWSGVYRGLLSAGRTVPKSYPNPTVFNLADNPYVSLRPGNPMGPEAVESLMRFLK